MPLKHLTETVLVVLLGIVTILTGIVASTLPPLPEGFFAWAGVFFLAVLYPAVLYPKLKSDRADYAFRALHFAPAAILIIWMIIQVSMLKEPRFLAAHRVFTWGGSALAVWLVFLLLGIFCLKVIRRRVPRLSFLVLLLVPFLALASVSETTTHWDRALAGVLWEGEWRNLIAQVNPGQGSSSSLAASSKGEKNLSSSSVPEEEEWRKKLREVEEGKVHSSVSSPFVAGSPVAGVDSATDLSGKDLTKSGASAGMLGLFLLAGFCATVHEKTKRRLHA